MIYLYQINTATIYYGPHPCSLCGRAIMKAGREFGGTEFEAPTGIVYPNHAWMLHACPSTGLRDAPPGARLDAQAPRKRKVRPSQKPRPRRD